MHKIDLSGQRFGHLTVLYEAPKELRRSAKKVAWHCKCDCGNNIIVSTDKLRGGEQSSCGHQCPFYRENFIKDLSGQRFGRLTVVGDSGERQFGSVIWECKCACGKIIKYNTQTLQKGKAVSCGCLKESYGEFIISEILRENKISFEREYSFNTCRFPKTNALAKFDFYVNKSYLIEYDGSQHYIADNYKWNTQEKLKETQEHDHFKTQWCRENNIPLIRIPYTHKNEIMLQDLLLDTSSSREV